MPKKTKAFKCKAKGCDAEKHKGRGLCSKHYQALPSRKDYTKGYQKENAERISKRLKKYRKENAAHISRWKKECSRTFEGMVERMYNSMLGRVRGTTGRKEGRHYWFGKPIMPREDFLVFARNSNELHRLHKQWTNRSYDRKFKPCPDRVDSTKGYTPDNIGFVTVSQNAIRAHQVGRDNNAKIAYTLVGVNTSVHGQRKIAKPMRPGQRQAINDLLKVKMKKGTNGKQKS